MKLVLSTSGSWHVAKTSCQENGCSCGWGWSSPHLCWLHAGLPYGCEWLPWSISRGGLVPCQWWKHQTIICLRYLFWRNTDLEYTTQNAMTLGFVACRPTKIHAILIRSEARVYWPHFCRWQLWPVFILSRVVGSESNNVRRSGVTSGSGTRHSRSFRVILIGFSRNPKQGVVVMYNDVDRNLKLVKILQRKNSKFFDINHPTLVWRQVSEESIWISTNNIYFIWNQALKVIQGHFYWCQQKSQTGCHDNIQ